MDATSGVVRGDLVAQGTWLHHPGLRRPRFKSRLLRKPESGCLSCSTRWRVMATRHHISRSSLVVGRTACRPLALALFQSPTSLKIVVAKVWTEGWALSNTHEFQCFQIIHGVSKGSMGEVELGLLPTPQSSTTSTTPVALVVVLWRRVRRVASVLAVVFFYTSLF
ncbi:uncharacterized protein LOC124648389 [Lolium rigidum]|uniref:uncharacterized protein LOC124648389 n=1 Tax=Lolium rigidum TaxID=89674 RepID=UPI001F5DDEEF|nr:uncharacterized protein LOC124648389 [Lolium rigidum]